MPRRPREHCQAPACRRYAHPGQRFCSEHASLASKRAPRGPLSRPSFAKRGYGRAWARVRREVLEAHRIPRAEWRNYDLHHVPPYNPAVEPDHWRYMLVPIRHRDHGVVTATERHRKEIRT